MMVADIAFDLTDNGLSEEALYAFRTIDLCIMAGIAMVVFS